MNIHHFILIGNATKDAEALESKAGKKYTKFSLAVNQYLGPNTEEKTYFYDILVFGKTVDKVVELVKKGDQVLINGRPEIDAYMSKKDKEPKAHVTIIAESWKVLK